jgi:hypothetical protein
MVKKLITGILCMVTAFAGQTATSGGQIGVQITLNGAPAASASSATPANPAAVASPAAAVSCTSKSGAAIGSTSVQVTCTSNVYVNIAQVNVTRESISSVAGQFITGFGLARSSTFPERVAGQIDDAVPEDEQGWYFEGRNYAGNETPERAKQLAKWRLWNREGTLTALGVAGDAGQSGAVEMLVSF